VFYLLIGLPLPEGQAGIDWEHSEQQTFLPPSPPVIIISAVPLTAPPQAGFSPLFSRAPYSITKRKLCEQFRSNPIIFVHISILVYFGSFYRPPYGGINKRQTRQHLFLVMLWPTGTEPTVTAGTCPVQLHRHCLTWRPRGNVTLVWQLRSGYSFWDMTPSCLVDSFNCALRHERKSTW